MTNKEKILKILKGICLLIFEVLFIISACCVLPTSVKSYGVCVAICLLIIWREIKDSLKEVKKTTDKLNSEICFTGTLTTDNKKYILDCIIPVQKNNESKQFNIKSDMSIIKTFYDKQYIGFYIKENEELE